MFENMPETIELFFIGQNFYSASRTMMSSIYVAGTFQRFDWGFVSVALSEGKNVNIRQATDAELAWATRKLNQQLSAKE